MLRIALLVSAAGRFAQAFAADTPQLACANVLLALCRASAGTLAAYLTAQAAPEGERGMLLGLSESVLDAAGVYAPLLSTRLVEAHGTAAPAVAAGCLTLCACACACAGLREEEGARPVPAVQATPVTAAAKKEA